MENKTEINIGDTFQAKDGSGHFVIEKMDIVGVWGTLLLPNGNTVAGAATWHQVQNDFTKVPD